MKKFILPILLFPLLAGGCAFNWFKKKSNNNDEPEEKQPVEEEHYINVSETEFSLEIGQQHQIQITELKKSIIICQSNNEDVATVTQSGLVTAVSVGETSITITGGKDRFVVFVTVLPPEAKDSLQIVMVKTSFTVALDDEYILPLTVKLGNEVVNNPNLSYAYETAGIVSISGLNVTPLSAGTTKCVVTASHNDLSTSSSFTITIY